MVLATSLAVSEVGWDSCREPVGTPFHPRDSPFQSGGCGSGRSFPVSVDPGRQYSTDGTSSGQCRVIRTPTAIDISAETRMLHNSCERRIADGLSF